MSSCLLCQETIAQRSLFLDIFFIKQDQVSICSQCTSQFVPISELACVRCCKENNGSPCSDCQYWENRGKTVDHQTLYRYNEKMMNYFSMYKFQGDYCLRKVFAKEVRLYLAQQKDYAIVPIPISQERYAERGFNQVIGVLDAAGISYKTLLKKNHSKKQSEKSRLERLESKQVFYIEEKNQVPEKIILVDDIYTTGATLQLAKDVLMKNGAKIVKTFSIAR